MPADGELTGRLGEEIHNKLSGEGYTILYDHGPSGAPGVGAIAAFCGEELHRETKQADLDNAVLDPN